MRGGPAKALPKAAAALASTALAALLLAAPGASAAPQDPLFLFTPIPPPPPAKPVPPPTGYLNGPCGLEVDGSGSFWVSDHYHRAVDVFGSDASYVDQPLAAFGDPDPHTGPVDDPCALALDSSETLYVNNYHRNVARFPAPHLLETATVLAGSEGATGVAVDPDTDHVYVNLRTHLAEYDASGAFVREIGAASLGEGFGIAVSGFPGSAEFPAPRAGFLYVPDASDDTVKVYDPATDTVDPVEVIDGAATVAGGFVSLRDSSVAVDDASGELYVVDDLEPAHAERPQATIHVFDATGGYEGHLKYNVFHGAPSGLAVDNSASPRDPAGTQGRVYVSTGNGHRGGVYVYRPGAATSSPALAPTAPPHPPGSGLLFPTVSIGAAAGGSGGCVGDACQALPPAPTDPTLTTLLSGPGNPAVRYRGECARIARAARRLGRGGRRAARRAQRQSGGVAKRLRARAAGLRKKGRRRARAARRCRARARGRGGAKASAAPAGLGAASSSAEPDAGAAEGAAAAPSPTAAPAASPSPAPTGVAQGLLPGAAGFDAALYADGGQPDNRAGSHPYQLDLDVGLDQGDLRDLRFKLPPGLLLNPANGTGVLCSSTAFAAPRATPFAAAGESGESCPDRSQVGTIALSTEAGGGQARSFGLFNLQPEAGLAAQFGAAPFGEPLVFDVTINADVPGAYLVLEAHDIPQTLGIKGLRASLWGVPWDVSHDAQRGDCLNEAEPAFAWGKCSIGDPVSNRSRAFITLPTECGAALRFALEARSWGQPGAESAAATSGGTLSDCASLEFNSQPEALLSVAKASSGSGFVFRFRNDDDVFTDPRGRTEALVKRMVVELPDGVTLNPSVGAGLGVCTEAELARETAFNAPGAGCPNAAKIGAFSVGLPYYRDRLQGAAYLAAPQANPFGSLMAVYLVGKSADRGLLFRIPVKLEPDPGDGTITAIVDDLPQLPYTDLEVNFRAGQRATLVSPPRCGPARTRIELSPWAAGVGPVGKSTDSQITSGVDDGPCPTGTPPFEPEAVAGGVNSNVNSYTPYYVHLIRKDTEQEITSYSLALPKGITGKLAGIPFCGEAAIAAARANGGRAEAAAPSCPPASQVGRTETGYGVGDALTYADGRIYLAGPYKGAPLSLVTVNSATVGPFDLGTIVVRSAFQVDNRSAQLRIDSSLSDPIPHIIAGIPLHLRDVRVHIDRPQFTHNPSSCEPSALISRLGGSGADFSSTADDSIAEISKRFQLLNCLELRFKPRLALRLRGPVRRGGFPALRATFAARGAGDSNLKRIEVNMPRQLFLAQNHIRTVCTRVQFAAESCPGGSVYGTAVARTPLLDEPLRGRVYLRSSDNKLPDLVTSLRSGAIRIDLVGRIGPSRDGGIQAFFDNLPDAPIERFTMSLRGGRRGLLTNSVNICKLAPRASIKALGQNNIGALFTTRLRGQCHKRKKARKKTDGQRRRQQSASASELAQKGTLRVSTTGRLSPRKLPRRGSAPIAVSVGGTFTTTDGSLPPQLQSMRIELNRHGRLETAGLPECRLAQIQPASTARALRACRPALVGSGSFSVDVALAGQDPYPTVGRLLVFNGRHKGKAALLGQIYSAKPFASSFVVPFVIHRRKHGPYGLVLTSTLPRALTSWGHVTGLQLNLRRRYAFRGHRRSVLSAGCPAPRGFPGAVFALARTTFRFAGGVRVSSGLTRSCKVRG